jgi:hypothetical protein
MTEETISCTGLRVTQHFPCTLRLCTRLRSLHLGTDSAVNKYLDLYRATAENTYLYEGAFATGVRRVKVLLSPSRFATTLPTLGNRCPRPAAPAGSLAGNAVAVGDGWPAPPRQRFRPPGPAAL